MLKLYLFIVRFDVKNREQRENVKNIRWKPTTLGFPFITSIPQAIHPSPFSADIPLGS